MGNCQFSDNCLYKGCTNIKLSDSGSYDAEIMIVKSTLDKDCDLENSMFGEDSDKFIKEALQKSGLLKDPSKLFFTSLIRCGVDKKDKKLYSKRNTGKVIEDCSQHLEQNIVRLKNLKVIIPLGSEARDYFCQDTLTITKSVGKKYKRDFGYGQVSILPNFSPVMVAMKLGSSLTKFDQVFQEAQKIISGNVVESTYKTKFLNCKEFVNYCDRLIGYYSEGKIDSIAYDIETSTPYGSKDSLTALAHDKNEYITGFSIADSVERVGYYINLYHPRLAEENGEEKAREEEKIISSKLVELLETIPFYCHNSKFDILWTHIKLGLDVNKINLIDDTMISAYLLIGAKRDTGIPLRLKDLCKNFFGITDDWDEPLDIELSKFNRIDDRRLINIDFEVLCQYGSMDAIAMLDLRYKFLEEFDQERNKILYSEVYPLMLNLIKVFVGIESRGVTINYDLLDYLNNSYKQSIKEFRKSLDNLPKTQEFFKKKIILDNPDISREELEDRLTKQTMPIKGNLIKEYLFDFLKCPTPILTDKGAPSLNADARDILRKTAPEEYQREAVTLLTKTIEIQDQISKYIKKIKLEIDKFGGHYPDYNLSTVATGRLSSFFHTLPSFGDIKYLVTSNWNNIGGLIMAPDYSQVEVRVIASMSGDENLKQAYIEGLDIHKFVASKTFNVDYDDVAKLQRSYAKTVIFGMLYGESVYTLAGKLGVELEEAQKIQDAVFNRFPKLKQWIDKTIKYGEKHGYVASMLGRRRDLTALQKYKYSTDKRERMLYSAAVRAAQNHPVQSSASDITLSSIYSLDKTLKDYNMNTHFIGTVHDSMELDVHPSEIIDTFTMIKFCCEKDLSNRFDWLNGVPYRIDIEMGSNWGSCMDAEILEKNNSSITLELSGRDIGYQSLLKSFDRNEFINYEVLNQELTEVPPEVDTDRTFHGIVYPTSKYKVESKIRLIKK